MGRRPALFSITDLRRAWQFVREEELQESHRVAIGPDGSIIIEPLQEEHTPLPSPPHLRLVKEDDIAI